MSDVDQSFEDSFLRAIIGDVIAADTRDKEQSTPETRQTVIRTSAAAMEGLAWHYCDFGVSATAEIAELSESERKAIKPTSYMLDDKGNVQDRDKTHSHLSVIRFTANLVQRLTARPRHDFGSPMWANLQELRSIRNRITHPKKASDLTVSPDEVARITTALDSFLAMMTADMDLVAAEMRNYTKDLVEIADRLKEGDPKMTALYRQISAELGTIPDQ